MCRVLKMCPDSIGALVACFCALLGLWARSLRSWVVILSEEEFHTAWDFLSLSIYCLMLSFTVFLVSASHR